MEHGTPIDPATWEQDVTAQEADKITWASALPASFKNLKPTTRPLTSAQRRVLVACDGMRFGFVSKGLVYDRAFRGLRKTDHKILVRLVLGGQMRIIRRRGALPGDHGASRVGAAGPYWHELRAQVSP